MKILTRFSLTALTLSHLAHAKCTCEVQNKNQNSQEALTYKLAAIASILMSSAFGVCLPLWLKNVPSFQPNSPIHFCIKAFAAGVILATGFLHILPDAFESLTSPCISKNPWGSFPFAGLVAMSAAIATLSMEAFATGFHKRAALAKAQPVDVNVDGDEESSTSHVHGQAIMLERSNSSDLLRHRVVSQVLELGILVHSVIIGISLGATQSLKTIKPLTIALSFHQFFEGIGLGGCIFQAKYKVRAITIMVLFFSLTTPTGIAIGISISKVYHDHSSKALVVEGILNSASAGILIYMALVDLLAADFMNTKLQTNLKLQLGTHFALLMGACSMGILARYGGS